MSFSYVVRLFLCVSIFTTALSPSVLALHGVRHITRVANVVRRVVAQPTRKIVPHIPCARTTGTPNFVHKISVKPPVRRVPATSMLQQPKTFIHNAANQKQSFQKQSLPLVNTDPEKQQKRTWFGSIWNNFRWLAAGLLSSVGIYALSQESFAQQAAQDEKLTWPKLNAELDKFTTTLRTQLNQTGVWTEGNKPEAALFDLSAPIEFKPYAQKLIVPAESTVVFFGDLHGEIDSLNESKRNLIADKLLDRNNKVCDKAGKPTYIVFLGDYVDRGTEGAEVIQTLLRLKNANPDRVFMVRGNHEDANQNMGGGFGHELKKKFGNVAGFNANKVYRMYDLLPPVLFIGCADDAGNVNFIQCCHGGLELGYNPQPLFQFNNKQPYACTRITSFDRGAAFRKLPADQQAAIAPFNEYADRLDLNLAKSAQPSTLNGHMWSDSVPDNGETPIMFKQGRGWAFGKSVTASVLEQFSTPAHKLRGIFRAHQHHGKMLEHLRCSQNTGLVQLWQEYQLNDCKTCGARKDGKMPLQTGLWDGIVCTFLSTPVEGTNFRYHAYGVLTTAQRYEDWRLEIKATRIGEKKN